MSRIRCISVLIATVLFSAGTARASATHLRLDSPGSSADSFSGMEGTSIPGQGEFVLGFGGGVRAKPWGEEEIRSSEVDHLISLDMSMLIGVMASSGVSVNLSYVALQEGGKDVSSYGLGDSMLKFHLRILDNRNGGPGLCLMSELGFPSGSPSDRLGSGMWSTTPWLVADFKLLSIQLAANVGVRFYSPGRGEGVSGSDFLWKIGLKVPVVTDILVPYVYFAGDSGLAGDMKNAILGDLGNKFTLSDEISLDFFGGMALLSGSNAPQWRAGVALRWQPLIGDLDEDGVAGSKDKCPYLPEDLDGFEDDDGCPDPDNDRDGVPDEDDACPNEAGDGDDGCPIAKTAAGPEAKDGR